MNITEIERHIESAAALLKALSNKRRLSIVCALYRGEKSVGELEQIVGLSQSALSQHLARLRYDDLVRTRRRAQTIYYSLSDQKIIVIMRALHHLYCTPDDEHQTNFLDQETGKQGSAKTGRGIHEATLKD